jgi:hypothetical protein
MHAGLVATLAALIPVATLHAEAVPPPPGIVIHHRPASTGLYIGSPSLCVLPNGDYLASHDLFGPASKEHDLAKGRLYRSTDKGATWSHVRDFEGFFWTGLFTRGDAAYLLGTDKHHGRVVIRRSTDNGTTWSEPSTLAGGQWHTAPMPVIEHVGRLWRAIEDAEGGTKWGERYRARMMSAPAGADLLDPESWTFSNPLARDASWLGGDFAAWLEGNAVADSQGGIVNLLRVDTSRVPEKAAVVRISKDGTTATFDPARDFTDFPGGAKKFTIRQDPRGGGYWSLASIVPGRHAADGKPAGIRNTLALVHSKDLRSWDIRSVLLYHPDVVKHGFQYVDWHFDGADLIAACRTAWDDAGGGARNNHDANFLTFHRWQNFRALTRKDDVPMPEFIPKVHETANLTVKGSAFEIAPLKEGETAFSNRGYRWHEVPASLAGTPFTRLAGGEKPRLEVTAKADTVVRVATATDQGTIDLEGWTPLDLRFYYDDPRKTRLHLFSRPLKKGESLRLPRGNWTGALLLLD